jgi:hypothetical protein
MSSSPLFSKRHYEWLAAFARAELSSATALVLCNALDREGARFNRAKFLVAAGVYDAQIEHARKELAS